MSEQSLFEIHPNTQPVPTAEREALLANPGFGRVFTDHMVTIRYAEGKGWYDARVEAKAPISLDPATAVLHYAQEIFEGLKAYRHSDGAVTTFRADANAARFIKSAHRMAMAPLPSELFLGSIRELVSIDREWIPTSEEGSLYLRPFQFASEVFLGVRPAKEYLFCLIASSVGAYFSGGVKPVSLWVSDEYTRAAPGGTGAAKCGGNYATSLLPQAEAIEHGCDQVVFLDAVEGKYIDELGGMNIFFVLDDGTLVTPQLGTILPGITRDSLITMANAEDTKVSERRISIDEWREGVANGRIVESFACGTAAVVTPIGSFRSAAGDINVVGDGQQGPVTARLRKSLMDIQWGRAADPYGWTQRIL